MIKFTSIIALYRQQKRKLAAAERKLATIEKKQRVRYFRESGGRGEGEGGERGREGRGGGREGEGKGGERGGRGEGEGEEERGREQKGILVATERKSASSHHV